MTPSPSTLRTRLKKWGQILVYLSKVFSPEPAGSGWRRGDSLGRRRRGSSGLHFLHTLHIFTFPTGRIDCFLLFEELTVVKVTLHLGFSCEIPSFFGVRGLRATERLGVRKGRRTSHCVCGWKSPLAPR